MRWTSFAAALGFMVLGLPGPPSASGEDRSHDNVSRLVDQLGSHRFATRQAATRALDNLGSPALPALRMASHSPDPEVRRRAQALLDTIARRVERDRLLNTPHVHFVVHDKPVLTALNSFNTDTGLHIEFDGDRAALADRRVNLDTGDTSVWQALDKFTKAAGLFEAAPKADTQRSSPYPQQFGGARRADIYYGGVSRRFTTLRLRLTDKPGPKLPSYSTGCVRIRALPPDVRFGRQPHKDGEKVLALEVCTDPRLQVEGVSQVRVDSAVDDNGVHLTQATGPINRDASPYGRRIYYGRSGYLGSQAEARYVSFRLTGNKSSAHHLKELRGQLAVRVQTPPEPVITINDLLKSKGKEKKAGELHIKVVDVQQPSRNRLTVRLQVSSSFSDRRAMQRIMMWRQGMAMRTRFGNASPQTKDESPVTVTDSKGNELTPTGAPQLLSMSRRAMGEITQDMELTFERHAGQGLPAKLVYREPRHIVVDVPFELKKVRLP